MSKKANPTIIGAFIIIGVALAVTGLIVFSSGHLFSKTQKFILYFDGSLKGLNSGAPVQLKGVTIGSVVEVFISHDQAPTDHSMPVIIELDSATLRKRTDREVQFGSGTMLKQLVDQGFRARLDAASLVTGVLQVQLEMVPGAPKPVYHQLKPEYIEIPTAPTTVQMLLDNLGKLDIQGMTEKLNSIMNHIDTQLSEFDMKSLNSGLTNLVASLDRIVSSPDLTNSLASLHHTLDDFGALAKNINTNTLVQLQATLIELHGTVRGLSTMVAPDAPLQTELTGALEQLSNASRAMAELAEFLKRNPDALLKGRTPPKEKP